ncbi:unnamed protein product [Blepharisma stoltei]|uniref:non-specific serine/threonine protein kinase n=1 Tax=Blepharisma stoltei TaxID=1481888 RepID=A0AAU9K785_9CILI|nr:unnamed protein product [Blepharisma stoltei]
MGLKLCCAAYPEDQNKQTNPSMELSIKDEFENHEEPPTGESKKSQSPFAIVFDEPQTPSEPIPLYKRKSSLKFSLRRLISVWHEAITESYDIKERLGKGGCGEVWKVLHKPTGMERAMKSITKDAFSDNNEPDINEVNVLKELDHPNIIKIYDIIVSTRKYFIIMELSTGGDLNDFILKNDQLSEQDISKWMYNILSGISYLHSKNVIHMDIKPDNIMFQDDAPDSLLKIIDFGMSIIKSSPNQPRLGNGSIDYKAPEVFDGSHSAKADVWSCGVLLYWLLSRGNLPFHGKNHGMTINIIKNEDVIFPSDQWNWVTDGAKDLIRKMLTKDPDKRISAKDAFDHKWVQGYSNIPQIDPAFLHDAFGRLVKFKSYLIIRHAALEYISSHFSVSKDIRKLQKAFLASDKNRDGALSKEELSDVCRQLKLRKKTDIEELIEKLDTDQNGQIDFSEFITGALDWEKNMSKKKLEATFRTFDLDKSGEIDLDELKQVLGDSQMVDEETWNKILSEADFNQDGKIQLAEFEMILTATYLDGRGGKDIIIPGFQK